MLLSIGHLLFVREELVLFPFFSKEVTEAQRGYIPKELRLDTTCVSHASLLSLYLAESSVNVCCLKSNYQMFLWEFTGCGLADTSFL